MMGIGPVEILVILVVALLVIGPEKMPELARALARVMRDLRGAMDEVRGQFEDLTREDLLDTKEIDDYYRGTIDSVKSSMEPPADIKDAGKEIEDTIKQIEKPDEDSKPDPPPAQPAP